MTAIPAPAHYKLCYLCPLVQLEEPTTLASGESDEMID